MSTKKTAISQDVNRLTKEANYELFSALTTAMKQVQGEREVVEAIEDSELYCELLKLQNVAFNRVRKHDHYVQQYQDMEMGELLKQLYQRMQTLHHYGACKGRELKGIDWTEENGIFIIRLRDCAINMEHSICDEQRLPEWSGSISELNGNLYAIGYDPSINCDDVNDDYYQHYEEALTFLCELNTSNKDATEHRDVTLCSHSWQHRDLLRDTLATLDMIFSMQIQAKLLKQ